MTAPTPSPQKEGFLKVRLQYKTHDPKHIRSQVLQAEFGIKPPYLEDVCVWVRPQDSYPRLSCYEGHFAQLQQAGVVPGSATLHSYKIVDEDVLTLAYSTED